MPGDQLLAIQRANVVLGIAATATSGLIWGAHGMLATGVGAALALANFWAIRRLGARAIARVTTGSVPQALSFVAALVAKMAVLFALVWLVVSRLKLPILPFTMGISVFVASIFLVGLYQGTSALGLAASSDGAAPNKTK